MVCEDGRWMKMVAQDCPIVGIHISTDTAIPMTSEKSPMRFNTMVNDKLSKPLQEIMALHVP
jgi:hypothetical protein